MYVTRIKNKQPLLLTQKPRFKAVKLDITAFVIAFVAIATAFVIPIQQIN